MSRLYHTEQGRVLPSLGEELTRFRRACKELELPATAAPAQVWLLVRCHPDNSRPLHLRVNGADAAEVAAARPGAWHWARVEVAPGLLCAGVNRFELWTESTAFDAWSLALEPGHPQPGSLLSDDGGATWRRRDMGYLNAVLAEYVVRVRLREGRDPDPEPLVWEDPASPRLASLRQRLPAAALGDVPVVERARALSSWLAASWEHTSSARASQYAPWDAETLLAWGPARCGHDGRRPIAMCVHYAAAFVSAAQAAGMAARCAPVTEAVNGTQGHFVAEVWAPCRERWIVVDPNSDALFVQDGEPMSMSQIQALLSPPPKGREPWRANDADSSSPAPALKSCIEYGPGTDFQRTFPHMVEFMGDNLERGVCFRHRSVWHRADLLTQPWLSPPGHGSISYCETGLVWEQRDLACGFGMFPAFGDAGWFNAPPPAG